MILRSLALFAATLPLVLGDVKFTSPAAGATLTGGGTISVEWSDSGTAPAVTDLSSYQLFLCAGGNDASNFVRLSISRKSWIPDPTESRSEREFGGKFADTFLGV